MLIPSFLIQKSVFLKFTVRGLSLKKNTAAILLVEHGRRGGSLASGDLPLQFSSRYMFFNGNFHKRQPWLMQ